MPNPSWLDDLLHQFPDDGNPERRRRMMALARWPHALAREVERQGRKGAPGERNRLDSEMDLIRAAVP